MKKHISIIILLMLNLLFAENKVVYQQNFHPTYTLIREASNYPGHRPSLKRSEYSDIAVGSQPILFYDEKPSERMTDLIEGSKLESKTLTIELWIKYHVNSGVGALATLRQKNGEPSWLLGFHDEDAIFTVNTGEDKYQIHSEMEYKEGYKEYWTHLVAVLDGKKMVLYNNGKKSDATKMAKRITKTLSPCFEMAAYTKNEPYMKLNNMVKNIRISNYPLSKREISKRYDELKELVDNGIVYDDHFHYTAGPYLNYAQQTKINLLWETDQPAKAIIKYGKTEEFGKTKVIDDYKRKHEIQLSGLEPETRYYYEISSISAKSDEINSGTLTFFTAVDEETAFSFVAVGDTEGRPFINDKISDLIWGKRPNFVVMLGDLTDGGTKTHRYEWTHEYFTGVTQLASRVPFFPVPGNGEDDLVWYNHYHYLPEPEGYYKFRYGNAEFFMINSNERKSGLTKGGEQYKWLDKQLSNSDATWKFVAHHHSPYTSEQNDYGDTWETSDTEYGDVNMRKLLPLYEKYDVDMVFYAHIHSYERSWPLKDNKIDREDGIIFIQAGGAGGNLADHGPTPTWFNVKKESGYHFTYLNIFKNTLEFGMYDIEGDLKDSFKIVK